MNRVTHLAVSHPALSALLLALGGFSLFSVGDAFLKALTAHYNPFTIAFYMGTMIITVCLTIAACTGRLRALLTLPDRKWHIVRAACLATQFYLTVYAFGVMPLAVVYALLFAAPLMTVLLAWLLLGERPAPSLLVLIAVGFAGILIILRPGLIPLHGAAIGMIAAAIVYALSHIIVRKMKNATQPLLSWPLYTELVLIAGALPFFLQAPVLPPAPHLLQLFIVAMLSLAALAMVGSALRIGNPTAVAPFQYVQMLWAIALGYLFFDDMPDLWTMAGATLIIGSGLAIIRREHRPAQPVTTLEHTI